MTKTRVVLADDHKLMRTGLRLIVDQHPEFTVVGGRLPDARSPQ